MAMVLGIAFMSDHKAWIHKVDQYLIFGSLTSHDKHIMIMSSLLGVIIDYFLFDDVVGVGIFDVGGGLGDRQSETKHVMCFGGVASSFRKGLLEATSRCTQKATFMVMMGSNEIDQ